MWIKICVFLLIAVSGAGLVLWDSHFVTPQLSAVDAREGGITKNQSLQPLPKFSLPLIEGEALEVTSLSRPVVLVHFWASWCAPCIVEFPDLMALAEAYDEQVDLVLISLDTKPEAIEVFRARLKGKNPELKLDAPNVYWGWDEGKAISLDIFATSKVPETFFIDQKRMIRDKKSGEVQWMGADIKTSLDEILRD